MCKRILKGALTPIWHSLNFFTPMLYILFFYDKKINIFDRKKVIIIHYIVPHMAVILFFAIKIKICWFLKSISDKLLFLRKVFLLLIAIHSILKQKNDRETLRKKLGLGVSAFLRVHLPLSDIFSIFLTPMLYILFFYDKKINIFDQKKVIIIHYIVPHMAVILFCY